MRPSRTIARLGVLACLFVTASLWARTALQSSAAPSDFLDVPGSLAANADGDVYVSFAPSTDASVTQVDPASREARVLLRRRLRY